jgi:hypothetical protein
MSPQPLSYAAVARRDSGFTLLEVMIACFVFFTVAFSVLQLTTQSLAAAKSLRKRVLDPGMVAAELSITNRLEEGTVSGDFGDIYPDYSWEYTVQEVESNGLFQVEFVVLPRHGGREEPTRMSALFYRPGSPPGSRFGGIK